MSGNKNMEGENRKNKQEILEEYERMKEEILKNETIPVSAKERELENLSFMLMGME
jgi:hypothetical protein